MKEFKEEPIVKLEKVNKSFIWYILDNLLLIIVIMIYMIIMTTCLYVNLI